jgi:hypothetical protein
MLLRLSYLRSNTQNLDDSSASGSKRNHHAARAAKSIPSSFEHSFAVTIVSGTHTAVPPFRTAIADTHSAATQAGGAVNCR